jgi:hypothetical protein
MSTPNPNRKIYKPSLIINNKILVQKDGKVKLGVLGVHDRTRAFEKHGA